MEVPQDKLTRSFVPGSDEMETSDEVFPCKQRLCVICVSEAGAGDEGISPEGNLMLDEETDVDAYSPEIFLKGLAILCEKLGVDDKYGAAEFWEIGGMENFVRFVCCNQCYQLLKRLVALQELILATQKSFTGNVEKIETCVIESAERNQDVEFSFNSCFQFRRDVLSNYQQKSSLKGSSGHVSTRRKTKAVPKPGPACTKKVKRSKRLIAEEDVKLSSCFVKLERGEAGTDAVLHNNWEADDNNYDDLDVVDNDGESEAIMKLNYDDNGDKAFTECPENIPLSPVDYVAKDDDDEDFKPKARRRRGGGKPRKRGRPKKKLSKEEKANLLVKRKRGRPPKPRPIDEIKIKRPRGRPKRTSELENFLEDVVDLDDTEADANVDETATSVASFNFQLQPRRKPSRSRPRNSGRPSGRPRKALFSITVEQAKELINDESSIKPILALSPNDGIYSYHSIRMQRDGTNLLCKHPGCSFFVGDMTYFSDQLAFRTMKLHIKHYHRLRNYRVYTNSENEKLTKPGGDSTNMYCCCYCDEQFPTRNNMLDHVRNSHAMAEPLQTLCEVCGDTMEHKFLLKHLNTHKNEEEKKLAIVLKKKRTGRGRQKDPTTPLFFPCDQCDKVCKNHTLLRIHKTSHVPIEMRKIFQCDICGERVSNKNTLRYHKNLVHFKTNIEYPYVCHICNKKYRQGHRVKFEVHMRVHSGEQPFQCTQCGKGFHCKYNLNNHEKTHLDTKIQCEFCSQWYKNHKYLRIHHLKHHPDLVQPRPDKAVTNKYISPEYRSDFIGPKLAHPCEPCQRIYVFKSQLVAHMKHGHKLFLPKSEDYPDQNTFEMQQLRDSKSEIQIHQGLNADCM